LPQRSLPSAYFRSSPSPRAEQQSHDDSDSAFRANRPPQLFRRGHARSQTMRKIRARVSLPEELLQIQHRYSQAFGYPGRSIAADK